MVTTVDPLSAFQGDITPRRVSLLYQLALLLVTIAMVILPLIYIGVLGGVSYAVYWHLTENWFWVTDVQPGRGTVFAFVAYAGLGAAGLITAFFLIKPLFAPSTHEEHPVKLSERDQPTLFAFIRRICDLVRAPYPREVQLDSRVNASASFRRGLGSFFGNDLVLTIGLPLVSGITARQLAGILAHEFGHFAQGGGMRLSYLIRRINGWFARVVYQRDTWDQWLQSLMATDMWQVQLMVKLAQGSIWLSRRLLWCLMQVGCWLSGFMSRQMEFDADSYEAQVAGSDEFPRTAQRLRHLSIAYGAAMSDLNESLGKGNLPEDLAALVAWRESAMPDEIRKQVDDHARSASSSWHDTHPADRDRDAAALAIGAPGVFKLDIPAQQLFADYETVSTAVSRHFYATETGIDLDRITFTNATAVKQDREASDAAAKALHVFYGADFHIARMQPISAQSTVAEASAARSAMQAGAALYAKLTEGYHKVLEMVHGQRVASDMLAAQFTLERPQDFHLSQGTLSEANTAVANAPERLTRAGAEMLAHETAGSTRIAAALAWLGTQADASGGHAHSFRLAQAQQVLASAVPYVFQLRRDGTSLNLLLSNMEGHNSPSIVISRAKQVAQRLEVGVDHILRILGDTQDPYAEGQPAIARAMPFPTKFDNEFARAASRASVVADYIIPLAVRVQGELCMITLAAEETTLYRPN